jgi:hypothetical protein
VNISDEDSGESVCSNEESETSLKMPLRNKII